MRWCGLIEALMAWQKSCSIIIISLRVANQSGPFLLLYVLATKWLFDDPLNLKIKEIITFFDDSVLLIERLGGYSSYSVIYG